MSRHRAHRNGRCWPDIGGAATLALLAVMVVPASISAQEVELRSRVEPGKTYVYRQILNTEAPTPMGDMVQNHTFTVRQEVLALSDDGEAHVRVTQESLQVLHDGPMGRKEWDSRTDELPDDPMLRIMARMVGTSFDMRLAPGGQVRQMSGMDELLEEMLASLPDTDSNVLARTRELLEKTLRDGSLSRPEQGMQEFPEGPLAPGAEWRQEMRMSLPVGETRFDRIYRLRDVVTEDGSRIARIDVRGSAEQLEPDTSNPMSRMMDISGLTVSGDIEFDVDRGLVRRSSLLIEITASFSGRPITSRTLQQTELLRVE